MIAVDDASDCVFNIGSSIGLKGCFVEIVLILGIGERTSVWLKAIKILLYLLTPLLLSLGLLLSLPLPDPLSQLVIKLFLFPFFSCTC